MEVLRPGLSGVRKGARWHRLSCHYAIICHYYFLFLFEKNTPKQRFGDGRHFFEFCQSPEYSVPPVEVPDANRHAPSVSAVIASRTVP